MMNYDVPEISPKTGLNIVNSKLTEKLKRKLVSIATKSGTYKCAKVILKCVNLKLKKYITYLNIVRSTRIKDVKLMLMVYVPRKTIINELLLLKVKSRLSLK